MKEKYTTELIVNKLNKTANLAIAIVGIGFLLFATEDYSNSDSYRFIGSLADNLLFITLGLIILIGNKKKIKKIKDKYFEIDEQKLTISTGESSNSFDIENKPESIEIKLKEIIVKSNDNKTFQIILDEYSKEVITRKKIKKHFETLKKHYYA